jgi:hypothetical protein
MIIFVLMASLFNYQYTRTENYHKCLSEKTESTYCSKVIKDMGISQKALTDATPSESSMGG